jgi:hypothetical protein
MKALITALCLVALPMNVFAQSTAPAHSAAIDATATPSPSPASSAMPTTVVMVPGGTAITVNFTQVISSDSETKGATVPVVATKEVDVNGMEVIAKGAQGQATLTTVLHSGGNGSGGQIKFNVDWIYSVDGGKIALSPVNNTTPNADRKGAASTLAIAGWATFGLLGLFSHNLAHGNAAVIKTDKTFTVFVDHDVHVQASTKSTAAPGFDN